MFTKQCLAFHALSRVISLAVSFSACLDFLSQTKQTDVVILNGIKIAGGVFFISLIVSIRNVMSVRVSREVELKCGDPTRTGTFLFVNLFKKKNNFKIEKFRIKPNLITKWPHRIYCLPFPSYVPSVGVCHYGFRIDL